MQYLPFIEPQYKNAAFGTFGRSHASSPCHLNLLYLSINLQMRSYSSFVSAPESTNVLANSLASFVETRDAFATIDARNDDATDTSIDDDANISFISYLNGAILFVFSIDWRFDDSFRLTLAFF
jgi:hypothetical protein